MRRRPPRWPTTVSHNHDLVALGVDGGRGCLPVACTPTRTFSSPTSKVVESRRGQGRALAGFGSLGPAGLVGLSSQRYALAAAGQRAPIRWPSCTTHSHCQAPGQSMCYSRASRMGYNYPASHTALQRCPLRTTTGSGRQLQSVRGECKWRGVFGSSLACQELAFYSHLGPRRRRRSGTGSQFTAQAAVPGCT